MGFGGQSFSRICAVPERRSTRETKCPRQVQPIIATAVQVEWVDDWYGTSCDAAEAAGASAERAERLRAFQDADLRTTVGGNSDRLDRG